MSGADNGTVEAVALEMAAKVFDRLAGCTIPLNFAKRVRDGEKSELVDAFKNAVSEALSPATEQSLAGEVVDMLLWCPRCGVQHIDEKTHDWPNPPHRSHLCQGCGCVWRPADIATNGVAAISTVGKADNWSHQTLYATPQSAPVTGGEDVLRAAVLTIMARCEALEDEASNGLTTATVNGRDTTHEAGFWRGQNSIAKSIRRHLHDLTRATLSPSAPEAPSEQGKLAQDVIDLVIASREAWERDGSSGDDMDKALEAFSSRIPYNDEPATTITRARKGAAS